MTARLRDNVTRMFTSFAGKDSQLVIPRPYISFCKGDILAALLLSQILYWADRTSDPEGWFAKSYEDWQTEIGMTEYQIKRAVHGDKRSKDGFKGLSSLGIETLLKSSKFYEGAPALHYRVNYDVLSVAVHDFLSPTIPNIVQDTIPNNVQNVPPNNVQDQYTETITETTVQKKEIESRALSISALQADPVSEAPATPILQSKSVEPERPPELRTEDHPGTEAARSGAQAVKAQLIAEGFKPDEPTEPLHDSTPVPFGIARSEGLLGMKWERHPYWQAYQRGGERAVIEHYAPANIEKLINVLRDIDAKPDEFELAIREWLPKREARTLYKFAFAIEDFRKWRETQLPPPIRETALVVEVARVWKYAADSAASNRMVDFLSGNITGDLRRADWGQHQFRADPVSADELRRFAGWYKAVNPNRATPPETAKTLKERIEAYRATMSATKSAPASTSLRATYTPPPKTAPLTPEERARIRAEVQAKQFQPEGVPS